jgi:hypothetical protein
MVDDREESVLMERVKAKVANQYEDGNEPVPEKFEFHNGVYGEVIHRSQNEMSGTHQFDVSFKLNSYQVEVSVQMSPAELLAAGTTRAAALHALLRAISNKIAGRLMRQILRKDSVTELSRPSASYGEATLKPDSMHGACDGFGGSDYE